MVIGSSSAARVGKSLAIFLFVALTVTGGLRAQDQVYLKAGTVVSGQITGVSGGQIAIDIPGPTGQTAHSVLYLSDVQSVTMPTPDVVTQLKSADPATIIATLAPVVRQYAGLPADWVVDAMGQLADAYDAQGKSAQASQAYSQIEQLYPGSPYQTEATAGAAKLALNSGDLADALALLKPIVDQANQNLAPSAAESRGYAKIFLVYGQVLQAQKQNDAALEAYLTVKTLFYQNPALVDQAEKLADTLRAQAPGVSVR
jgi:hypothetical protein